MTEKGRDRERCSPNCSFLSASSQMPATAGRDQTEVCSQELYESLVGVAETQLLPRYGVEWEVEQVGLEPGILIRDAFQVAV